jgi:hypothetical protein
MILTVQELRNLSPSLSVLGNLELEGLILRSQSLCESSLGANRELVIKDYVLERVLGLNKIALVYAPVTAINLVEVRYNNLFVSFGDIPVSQNWEVLPSENYFLIGDCLELNNFNYINANIIRGIRRSRSNNVTQEIRITYSAGLNFSATSQSQEILKIKSVIAAIAEVLYREQKIIKEESSQGAKIVYQDFNDLKPFANLLPLFYKYRPRT